MSNPKNETQPYINEQSSLFKKNEGIPQRFISRIKPEFCIETGKNASPQSFLSDGTLSKSQKEAQKKNSQESSGDGSGSFRLNPRNVPPHEYRNPYTGSPNMNHHQQYNNNHPQQQQYFYNNNPNHGNIPQNPNPNPQYPPNYNQFNDYNNQGYYHQQQQGYQNQWSNFRNDQNFRPGSDRKMRPPLQQHPLSVHSFDSQGSNSKNGKHPKSAYAPPAFGNRLQPPQNYNSFYAGNNVNNQAKTQEQCNHGHAHNGQSQQSCKCSMKRDTLAAKLILNSMTAGSIVNNNEKILLTTTCVISSFLVNI